MPKVRSSPRLTDWYRAFAFASLRHVHPHPLHPSPALSALQLPAAQEQFTAYPADLIPETEADAESLGVTILDGEIPVGYFVLSVGAQRD